MRTDLYFQNTTYLARGYVIRPLRTLLALLALLSVTSGCVTGVREYIANGFKVGPNYCPPQAPVSDEWIDYAANTGGLSNAPPDQWAWWQVFKDPTLEELVVTASNQNISLREAGYRIEETRALRAIAVGNLFPQQQTAFGQYRRQMLSLGTGITAGGGGGFPGAQRYFSVWNTGTQLAWELDFWGRFRRAVESADAQLDASVENYDDVLVMLIGDVASTYVEIRTVEQRIAYARANVESQQQSLQYAENRFKAGADSKIDQAQARTNLGQTQSTIPQLQTQLRLAQNRLCVLMGMPPRQIDDLLLQNRGIPVATEKVVIGIPAELVRRRPDVRRAEREVAAASARIGIAEADLYPAFTINGQIFVQANQFQDMFNSRAVGGSVGPSFNWNIFNYGRIRNNIVAEEARFMQEVAQYQNVVLNANREAEDAIVSFLKSREQEFYLRSSSNAAKEARDTINDRYRGGKDDFNRVFVADLALTQQQDALAQAQGEIALSLVDIYRALGGGWQIRLEDLPPMNIAPVEEIAPEQQMMRNPLMERLPPTPESQEIPTPDGNP